MRWSVAIAVVFALLWAEACNKADHCEAYVTTCETWCEGALLESCLADGHFLLQERDQDACFDANMRLTCGDLGDKHDSGFWHTGYWHTGYWHTGYWHTGDWHTGDWHTGDWHTGDIPCDTADTDCGDTGGPIEPYTGAMSLGVDTNNPTYPTTDDGSAHNALSYGCDPTTSNYWYLFFTIGWSSGGELTIYQTGTSNGWNEDFHDIPASGSYGYDANGWWDSLFLSLPIVTTPSEVVLNNTAGGQAGTTLFQCDQARLDALSWLLTVRDSAAANSVCTTFGENPAFYGTGGDYASLHGGTPCDSAWQ